MRTLSGLTPVRFARAVLSSMLCSLLALSLVATSVGEAEAKRNKKYAAYVIDAKTGKVLHSRHANAHRYPASLTKMMTLYLVFEDLKRGRIKKSSRIKMSRFAASRQPSKLGVRAGRSVSVEQAIYSLVTKSANDVATAVAENLGGSEAAFARRMTRTARKLGMSRTTFRNANGLTARGQITTASDMAKLGIALRQHFPREFRYFKTRSFKYGKRRFGNYNKLLGRVRGVDGIKTGYTRASGFNLVTSVSHRGCKIVAVVMGGRSGRTRNAAMTRLVKRYLPKASCRAKERLLVARPGVTRIADLKLPKVAPMPAFSPRIRADLGDRVAVAHAASKPDAKAIATVKRKLVAMAGDLAPKPDMRPTASISKPVTAQGSATAKPEPTRAPSGWQIQISAAESVAKAEAILEKARARTGSVLGSKETFTQKIVKDGVPLYRARFVGFSSKNQAKRACKALKRKRFACIALHV